jgi:hypothetical protein
LKQEVLCRVKQVMVKPLEYGSGPKTGLLTRSFQKVKEREREDFAAMDAKPWFDHLPVLSNLPPKEAAAKLRDVGEIEAADLLETGQREPSQVFGLREHLGEVFKLKPYQHAGQTLGYIASTYSSLEMHPIEDISRIPVPGDNNASLLQARVKITLDCLRVAGYPGSGIHQILIHFFAQNQVQDRATEERTPYKSEDVHFNATYRVRQGGNASVRGYPIFVGLHVGGEGLLFKCRTINVKNERDEAFLSFLRSGVFKAGLHLVSAVQPAIAPLSAMAYGLAEAIADHHRNFSVQDVTLGLDFGTDPSGVRLAEGAYIAVQSPPMAWEWDGWVYNRSSNLIVRKDDLQPLPYNYLIFGISRYRGE